MGSRTELLLGLGAIEILNKSRVAVFGIGGVGSHAVEALARCGVGSITISDPDVVSISNLNRQIHALRSTLGRRKVDVMRERILDVNPCAKVFACVSDEDVEWDFDCVVDATDTVTTKLRVILEAKTRGVPVISSMGAGNKIDPARFRAADIYETRGCPLAKIIRRLCRENEIEKLKVVFSDEPPISITAAERGVVGSVPFVPAAAGLLIAKEVVFDLINGMKIE